MVRQEKSGAARLYRLRCSVCGGQWDRAAYSRAEVREYLRTRDVCWAGKHVVEGSLLGVVRVRRA